MGDGYFDRIGTASESLFESHLDKVKWAFKHGFRSAAPMENYTNTFSTANWEMLPAAEKSLHSLSNCVAQATQFEQLQKTFPLKPLFCPTLDEKDNLSPREIDAVVHQATGVPFAELAANMGYKSATEVNKIVSVTKTQCMHETREKLISECSCLLHTNVLQAAYESDVTFSKFKKMRLAQYFTSPSERTPKKKRYPLHPKDCDRFDKLSQTLSSWDSARKLVAS